MPDIPLDEASERPNGQRVRQVKVPGSVTGFVTPSEDDTPGGVRSTEAGNGHGKGDHGEGGRWRSVRLRLGSGAGAGREQGEGTRGDAAPAGPRVGDAQGAAAATGPGDGPAMEAPAGRRRRVLLAALGLLAAVVIVVQFVLLLTGHDKTTTRHTVSVPSLTSAPPASTNVTPPPLRFGALKGAGAARADATLTNAGHELALTVRADVPHRLYGVALISPGVRPRAILFSHGGRGNQTLRIGWRGLARYQQLSVFVQVPRHATKGRGHRRGKGKHHRARTRQTRMIMRLSVNRLVRDSGVRLIG